MKVTGQDDQRWPCQSSHRITVSLDGVQPLTITLPHPILPDTFKATLRRNDRIVDLAVAKALYDLWPEDVIRDQFRWNADKLEPWTNRRSMLLHLQSQFRMDYLNNFLGPNGTRGKDALTRIREFISAIFSFVTDEDQHLFAFQANGQTDEVEWYVRAHPPVRISPRGSPILLLSVLEESQIKRPESKLKGRSPVVTDFEKVFMARDLPIQKEITNFALETGEEIRLFRHILRYNSTKIQPTAWQKENLSQGESSPWLATFIRPLYLDGLLNDRDARSGNVCCAKCRKSSGVEMKRCGRCRKVSYCSVECQRSDWAKHKPSCSQKS